MERDFFWLGGRGLVEGKERAGDDGSLFEIWGKGRGGKTYVGPLVEYQREERRLVQDPPVDYRHDEGVDYDCSIENAV